MEDRPGRAGREQPLEDLARRAHEEAARVEERAADAPLPAERVGLTRRARAALRQLGSRRSRGRA